MHENLIMYTPVGPVWLIFFKTTEDIPFWPRAWFWNVTEQSAWRGSV